MTAADRRREAQSAVAESEEEGFDLEGAKQLFGLAWRAPGRHPVLAFGAFLVVFGLGLTVAVTMPRSYNSTARLLSQKTAMLPALGNPNLTLREGDFAPTKDIADVIRRRENIIQVVKDTNLVERFYATRSPALRFKDKVFASVFAPLTDDERGRDVVGTLEKKLVVTADESSVTISVDWPDPNAAYAIVNLLQKNLIEARYDSEVAMIEDAIALLEDHGKQELDQVDSALADLKGLQGVGAANAPPSEAPTPGSGARAAPAPRRRVVAAVDADLAEALLEKRQQIKTFEDDRKRTLDALKQQLMQAQLTLTAMHPTIVALQKQVDDLGQPSPELARLKAEERAIMAQLASPPVAVASNGVTMAMPRSASPASSLAPGSPVPNAVSEREDPVFAAPRERLSRAISRYQDVMARIDAAKLQLDISRTAYQYRYRVITPAEVALAPKKPIAQLVGIASLLGSLLVAFLVAAFADWSAGLILETWQVRRVLKLDVLSELDPPV
jgi:uncharacterized protein involved in exopolysaccharide biosynthesis